MPTPRSVSLGISVVIASGALVLCWAVTKRGRRKGSRYHQTVAANDAELKKLRGLKWELFAQHEESPLEVRLRGQTILLRAGLTLTPYANATQCSAHCPFCSQELGRTDSDGTGVIDAGPRWRVSSQDLPRPENYDLYFEGLSTFFGDLRASRVQVGLSLSGLEVTTEATFFYRMMSVIKEFHDIFDELVVYSNATGFVNSDMVAALAQVHFDRVELNRQSFDAKVNQKIMRFDRAVAIKDGAVYASTVSKLRAACKCLLHTCLLSRVGVATIEDVEQYVMWSQSIGVDHILFQEMSRLDHNVHSANNVSKYIEDNRICIEAMLEQVMPAFHQERTGWQYQHSRIGYYYYYEVYRYGGCVVTFGVPSYAGFYSSTRSGHNVVDKLIFWGDLSVTADWDHRKRHVACYGQLNSKQAELF